MTIVTLPQSPSELHLDTGNRHPDTGNQNPGTRNQKVPASVPLSLDAEESKARSNARKPFRKDVFPINFSSFFN